MTSLECHTDDELESTVGDLDEATDTETESMSDGTLCSYTMTCKQYQVDATKFLDDCLHCIVTLLLSTHTHTHPFNGPFSGTTRVSRYQKGKTSLDFTEAKDSEWQWHQLGHMQVCISLQTDNHTNTSPLSFYRPDALPATQPTASKH